MIPLFVGLVVAVLQVVIPLVAGDVQKKDAAAATAAVLAGGAGSLLQRRKAKQP